MPGKSNFRTSEEGAADTTGAADATTAAPPPSLLASRPDTPGAGSPAHQRGSPAPGSASLAKGGRADVAGGRATPGSAAGRGDVSPAPSIEPWLTTPEGSLNSTREPTPATLPEGPDGG